MGGLNKIYVGFILVCGCSLVVVDLDVCGDGLVLVKCVIKVKSFFRFIYFGVIVFGVSG